MLSAFQMNYTTGPVMYHYVAQLLLCLAKHMIPTSVK